MTSVFAVGHHTTSLPSWLTSGTNGGCSSFFAAVSGVFAAGASVFGASVVGASALGATAGVSAGRTKQAFVLLSEKVLANLSEYNG